LPNIQIPPITNKIVIDIIEIISLQQYTDAIYFSDLDKSQYTTNKINSYSGSLILPTSITISINTNIKLDIENIIILPDTARIDNLGTIQNNLNNKINNLYKYKSNNDPVNVTNITKYIEKLYENIEYVRSNYLVINKDLKIYYDATINTAIIKEFYSKQEKLNKLINLYNKELQIYNKEVKYNNTLIIIGVIILIIIYLVPNKYKIIITAIIIISLIILLLNFSNNKETFMVLKKYQSDNDNIILNLSDNINLIKYKTARDEYILMLNDYIYNLYLISSNNDVSNSLKPMIMYKNKLHKAKTEKIEYYKLRYTDLINSIEIVKKSSNNYNNLVKVYYIILIVILICLILSILEINYKQIILIFIITLIVIIYIFSYKMHKITRMIENKYYWSNFNPYFI
jgi:Flp pilus assembly protein TadB